MKQEHGAAPRSASGICFLPVWYFPPPFSFYSIFLCSLKGCRAMGGAGKLSAGRYQRHDSLPGPPQAAAARWVPSLPQPLRCCMLTPPHLPCPRCLPLSLLSSPTIPPQERGRQWHSPEPQHGHGHGANSQDSHRTDGVQHAPGWAEASRSHLQGFGMPTVGSPPLASLKTASRSIVMGWQWSNREKILHK